MKAKASGARRLAAMMTASVAFVLVLMLATLANVPHSIAISVAGGGAALFALWLATRSMSARRAWGRGFLVDGLLSVAVGIGFQLQSPSWPEESQYQYDLDRAIGPLNHFIWIFVAKIGLLALILAVLLFALGYWLLRPPHRQA
jgi:hypothetical protein